ncbi:alpha/beta fold hydrolase [Nonomuraea sp. SYSU D8015]|uniref:alpha/beta fold hydrolase n=1 Tax=Nonomuraea sp. SYSU D8015 TaxID=2593644 RepID=UPI0016607EE1|nr:alpha/beta hydrolase [Nonomuraea sp. SYSU D8015]
MEETITTEDGVELWAARGGRGRPVVFCHGGPGLWDTLEDVAALLSGVATVHRWDQRGCGRSQRRGPYSMARTVADLDAVRRHFELETMVLLGHSWGAQLALRYTLDHPERVRGLVYVAGTGIDPGKPWGDEYARNLRARMGDHLGRWLELRGRDRTPAEDRELSVLQWSADFADPARALEQAERMATPWLGVNFECNAAINAQDKRHWGTPELRAGCEALQVPTLIVDGAHDIRPRWAVDSLEQALPRVSRVVLRGAGHMPWVEEPDGFRSAVNAFLASDAVSGAGSPGGRR